MQGANIVTDTVEKKTKKVPKRKPVRLSCEESVKNQYLTNITHWYVTHSMVEVIDGGNIQHDTQRNSYSAWCVGKLKLPVGPFGVGVEVEVCVENDVLTLILGDQEDENNCVKFQTRIKLTTSYELLPM